MSWTWYIHFSSQLRYKSCRSFFRYCIHLCLLMPNSVFRSFGLLHALRSPWLKLTSYFIWPFNFLFKSHWIVLRQNGRLTYTTGITKYLMHFCLFKYIRLATCASANGYLSTLIEKTYSVNSMRAFIISNIVLRQNCKICLMKLHIFPKIKITIKNMKLCECKICFS